MISSWNHLIDLGKLTWANFVLASYWTLEHAGMCKFLFCTIRFHILVIPLTYFSLLSCLCRYEGTYRTKKESVAIKVLKPKYINNETLTRLTEQLDLMRYFKLYCHCWMYLIADIFIWCCRILSHRNLVNFVGGCTQKPVPCVVTGKRWCMLLNIYTNKAQPTIEINLESDSKILRKVQPNQLPIPPKLSHYQRKHTIQDGDPEGTYECLKWTIDVLSAMTKECSISCFHIPLSESFWGLITPIENSDWKKVFPPWTSHDYIQGVDQI